jgi:adenylylsulfate kinase
MTTLPRCWWFTGLPGAGKTTLATAWVQALQARGQPACLLDGDEVRLGLCRDLGFSPEARHENMRRVAEMACLLHRSGIHAVVALVSPTIEGRALARSIVGADRFIEIHVATPLAVCEARDPKGLYARARANPAMGMTGVQAGYEPPPAPALSFSTQDAHLPDLLAQLLALQA